MLRWVLSVWVVLVVALLSLPARAEPMLSSLDEILAASPNVVIGTHLGPVGTDNVFEANAFRFRIESSIRGNLSGEVELGFVDGHCDVAVGARVVAFITAQRQWKAVGEVASGHQIESAPMRLRGFYDFNAHLVSPGAITLSSLRQRLAGQAMEWRLRGPLLVLSRDGQRVESSSIVIDVQAREGRPTIVRGLPGTGSFPTASISFGPIDNGFALVFRRSWPRPLVVHGEMGEARDGVIQTRFWIAQPDLLRLSEIRRYLRNANAAYPVYLLRARLENGETWTGTIGDDYTGGPFFRTPTGIFDYRSFSYHGEERVMETRDDRMLFPQPLAGPYLGRDNGTRALLQDLLRGPVPFEIDRGPRAGSRGTIELVNVEMRPPVTR